MKDESLHICSISTPSTFIFLEFLGARIAELTRLGATRLIEKSRMVKTTFKKYVCNAHAFLDAMVDISHIAIFEKLSLSFTQLGS